MFTPEQLQQGIYDHLAEYVVLQDAEHRVLWLNSAAASSVGLPKEALIGRTCFDAWHGRRTPCPDCPVSEARRTGAACRRVVKTLDGRGWLITGIPVIEDGAELDRAIEVALEITELQLTRQALADQSETLRSLFENSRDPVYITTRDGHFVAVNQAMVNLSGYARDELMELTAADLFENEGDRARFRDAVERDGGVKSFPVVLVARDGRSLECLLTLSARREDGEVAGYHGIIRDGTRDPLRSQSVPSALRGTIAALGQTVEMRDSYTAHHQRRVTDLATRIAKRLDFPNEDVECVRVAALMHDIGKLTIPAEILAKPSQLSDPELKIVHEHPQTACKILNPITFPWPVAPIILQHHERLDGSGYPSGLQQDAIDPKARVLAVADVVEAMTAHRPYRPALGIDRALEEIRSERGFGFDEAAVDACVELFESNEFTLEEGD